MLGCKHPLKAFCVGLKENGKKDIRVRPYAVDHLEMRNGTWYDCMDKMPGNFFDRICRDWEEIPCGKCVACRLDYARQWANRCMLELTYHDSAFFVTLTYNDDHLPLGWSVDQSTGEAVPAGTLCKRDFQLFMKRLRRRTGQDLRFYAAGEYGKQTFRPHYHAIIFGLTLDDLVPWKKSKLNFQYYTSEVVSRCWSLLDEQGSIAPLGYAVIGEVSWETCAYTARYTAKKNNTQDLQAYEEMGIEPPFTLMSRKPGIGRQYFDDHPDLFNQAYINISTSKGGKKFPPPKYFQNLLAVSDPVLAEQLKQQRKEGAIESKRAKMLRTDLDYLEMLQVEEDSLIARTKSLERSL